MEPVEDYPIMAKLPKVVLPLFWVEESAHLNTTYTNLFKYGLYLVLNINAVIKWTLLVVGCIGMILGMYLGTYADSINGSNTKQVRVSPKKDEQRVSNMLSASSKDSGEEKSSSETIQSAKNVKPLEKQSTIIGIVSDEKSIHI